MLILFDHGTPSGIARSLSGHEVIEAIERGWDRISNGELIRYQQNLTGRKIAIVVLGNSQWRVVRLYLDRVVLAVNQVTPGSYAVVDIPFNNPGSVP
jgi:hypothetical protein